MKLNDDGATQKRPPPKTRERSWSEHQHRADEMNVIRLSGEQIGVNRMGQLTVLLEIETNRGCRRCRRDVDRLRVGTSGNVHSGVPKNLRGTLSAVGPGNVQERQPSEARLERRMNNRETDRALAIEHAEKDTPTRNNRRAEGGQGRDSVRT